MMPQSLVIVDYGMGNLWSVANALFYLGAKPYISDDPFVISQADTLILPGVGSFRKAIHALNERRLIDVLCESVQIRKRKILGICLGMQLMAETGTEDGGCAGLGFFNGNVDRFDREGLGILKVPHVGFDSVTHSSGSALFRGIASEADFYFVHSYRLPVGALPGKAALCSYGSEFMAAYEYENIFSAQFHPEKSQTNGLIFLRNFLSI